MSNKVDIVVVDSGPLIKGAMLRNFAKHAVTVPGVIHEIKDVKTRSQIRNLPPYFFEVINPSKEALSHVILASKKSGDLKVLSKVDLDLLALAYQLSSTPEDKLSNMFNSLKLNSDPELRENQTNSNDDFFFKAEEYVEGEFDVTTDEEDDDEESENNYEESENNYEESENNDEESENNDKNETNSLDNDKYVDHNVENDETKNIDNVNDEEHPDGGTWCTPENYNSISNENLITVPISETSSTKIGCLSTDYALQNVLMHMNILVLSINGMEIKESRIYVSYCRSCRKIHRRPDVYFCTDCGNSNIGRIPAKISNGKTELFFKKNWQPNLRNCRFTVPNPQSGKHTSDKTYIYCADQRLPQERPKKLKSSHIAMDEELGFFGVKDAQSRSANLGIHQERVLRPTLPKCLTKKNNKRRRRK